MSDGFTEAMRGSASSKKKKNLECSIEREDISSWLKLPKSLEEDKSGESPYYIERKQEMSGKIIWYGYSLNWICDKGVWLCTSPSGFIPCKMPEYEKIFQSLK